MILTMLLVFLQFAFNKKNPSNKVQASNLILPKPVINIDYARAYAQIEPQTLQATPEDFALYKGYQNYLKEIPQELTDYFYFKVATTNKILVLSFDDGPLAYTPKLMDLLIETNTPATFFLLCNRINSTNSLWYANPLFSYGMHTFSHKDYSDLNFAQTKTDIDNCLQIFADNNLAPKYFRPAFGIITKELFDILKSAEIKAILWNIDSLDWDNKRGDELVNRVLDNLSPGSIILFHDGVNRADLKRIIEGINQRGYKIVSLEELLKYPKLNLIY